MAAPSLHFTVQEDSLWKMRSERETSGGRERAGRERERHQAAEREGGERERHQAAESEGGGVRQVT